MPLELSYISTYFVVSITASIFTALLILISGVKRHRVEFLALATLCFIVVFVQYFTWKYHQTTSVESAIFWLKLQSSSIILLLPVYFYSFSKWAKFKHVNVGVYACLVATFILLTINYASEFSIRFSSITQQDQVITFIGEPISILRGEKSLTGSLAHLFSVIIMLGLILAVKRLYVAGKKPVALLLGSTIVLQVICVYIGYSIDAGTINFVYVAGLPLVYLNVGLCIFGAISFRTREERIINLHERNHDLEQSISELAKGFNTSNSSDFYEQMLLSLYKLTNHPYIFIGLLEGSESNHIKTKIVLEQGKKIDNFTYALAHTPCENVLNHDACVYPQDITKLFPHDQLLIDMGIESYIGRKLMDEHGQLLGILTLLDTKPSAPGKQLIDALQVFASRASAELQRDSTQEKLRRLAYTDYSTNLANKARLFEVLNETLVNCELNKSNALFMLVDIDKFTDINRDLGYDIGESILRELGKRLGHFQNDNVFFARVGGDEFAAIFFDAGMQPSSFMQVQWDAIRAVLRKPIEIGEKRIRVEYSMGAVIFPQQTRRKYDVIQCAESALSQSKSKGRGYASMFEPALLETIENEAFIDSELRKALKAEGQLSLAYQPKVNVDGQLLGVEALIRWQHPQKGNIPPNDFINIAERSELIIDVGDWVIKEVCNQIKRWAEQDFSCKVAINLSAAQLLRNDFTPFIVEHFTTNNIPIELIELEITESSLLNDIQAAVSILKQLRIAGFRIALDDFGTGYSSLSYLRELPLDALKIDKAFIDKMEVENRVELVKTIISIGKHLSLDIVAEGVEQREQACLLHSLGCDIFQGFHFGRPMSGDAIRDWTYTPTD